MTYRKQTSAMSLQHQDTRTGERRAAARGTLDRRSRAYPVPTDQGAMVTDGDTSLPMPSLDVARAYARAHNIAYNHKD